MLNYFKYSIALWVMIWTSWSYSYAQKSAIYNNDILEYRLGVELFNKQKFGAAQKQFDHAILQSQNPESEVSINSEYYKALCALELFNKDAEHLLSEFVENHPESPRVKTAYFQLGKYNYRKKRWTKAIDWFSKVDMFDLTKEEVAEYHFKKGYSHFMLDEYESAGKILYEIKDVDTKYTAPARYYYSHIAYRNKDYQTALEGFNKLKENKKFASLVPYYITQIYYLQEKYHKVIAYAPPLLESAIPKRAPEISRLIGDSYYKTRKYAASIPYLEKYKNSNYNLPQEDKYQLGYAYYKSEQYEKAIKIFNKISNSNDEIAQTAYYHLADCYLKVGNKKFARNAYKSACEMDFDPSIQKDALYNYALLSYELSYDPYNKSIEAFKEYIEKYPKSEKTEEAYGYLVNVYMTTRNYKGAIQSIESIPNIDPRLKGAYQRVCYNSAVENYHNKSYSSAIQLFQKAQKYPIDRRLNTMCWYWIGESYYQIKNYKKCLSAYQQFIFEPGAILQKEFNKVHYNIAYAYFDQELYEKAIQSFRKFLNDKDEQRVRLRMDAYLRVGDSYFLTEDYYKAEGFYKKATEIGAQDADYAIYQRAIALGILKKREEKMKELISLLTKYPQSSYLVDTKYQLGKEYMFKEDTETALEYFNDVITNYPNSSYVKKSLLNTGLIYFNQDKNTEALAIFQRIVKEYPTYDDSKEALIPIKNIYVKLGKVDEYAEYMNSLSFANVSQAELDSITYEAAELQYMNGDCANAKGLFSKYLDQFATPIFSLNAHFYQAECHLKADQKDSALVHFNAVIERPLNKFTESSLVEASKINFEKKDFEEALSNFIILENIAEYKNNAMDAKVGQMRCFFLTGNYSSSLDYAKKVIKEDKVQENINVEAHLIVAKSALKLDSTTFAYQEFEVVTQLTQSIMKAEAKYAMAEIRFNQDKMDETENEIYDLVNFTPSYQYWVAKGLILLSDVYVKKDDLFQAKATLQSILENYEGKDELASIVSSKLEEIKLMEQAKEEPAKEELEIDFEGISDQEIDELFEEEIEEE